MSKKLSRRNFMGVTAASTAAFSIVPRHVLGSPFVAPSDKINIACIGTGTQGTSVMLRLLKNPELNIVSVCDPVTDDTRYITWSKYGIRDMIREEIEEPLWDEGVGGCRAGREPAKRIVEAWYGKQRKKKFKGITAYADFRECLELEKDIDGVVVATPDHQHAQVAQKAMEKGKHVLCQKPMTNTVYEARLLALTAERTGLVTQVLTGNASSPNTDIICEMIWSGAIGAIREVHNWSNRPVWPSGMKKLPEEEPVPDGFNWDLWLGPAEYRPFSYKYTHAVFRGWYDFGTGAIGDMGCYSMDVIYRALKLGAPATVEANGSFYCDVIDEIPTRLYNEVAHPQAMTAHYTFPARAGMPPVDLFWYDGGMKPPTIPELIEDGEEMPEEGTLYVGDYGKLLTEFSGGEPRLIPSKRNASYILPPETINRSEGHIEDWVHACKGSSITPRSNFLFAGPVTEMLNLGILAMRMQKRLTWDPVTMLTNCEDANKLIRRQYREGWEL